MNTRPNPLDEPFDLPPVQYLSTEQIMYTELVVDELLRGLLLSEELHEHYVALPLLHKLQRCINLADFASKDPKRKIGPELAPALRKLLALVTTYYLKLN